jgi:hypothetical protein
LAGILSCSLAFAFFALPNLINKYANEMPNEAILDSKAGRPSVQAVPLHQMAQRHSVDMVAVAKVSVRYSRKSEQLMK